MALSFAAVAATAGGATVQGDCRVAQDLLTGRACGDPRDWVGLERRITQYCVLVRNGTTAKDTGEVADAIVAAGYVERCTIGELDLLLALVVLDDREIVQSRSGATFQGEAPRVNGAVLSCVDADVRKVLAGIAVDVATAAG